MTRGERYELYIECAKILDKEGDSGAFQNYYLALRLFDEDQNFRNNYKKNRMANYQSEAEKLVFNAIKSPEIVNFEEVIALEAIQDLKKTSKQIFDFVDLFLKKEIAQFKKDLSSFNKLMDDHVVTTEMAIQKKQYIQICSLDLSEQQIYSFKDMATLLDIPVDEVEEWFIDAVTNNIVDARINQMNEEIIIKTHKLRNLSDKEWVQIKDQITEWREKFEIVETILSHQPYVPDGP